MPLKVLTRDNIKEVSKESGHSEEELQHMLMKAARTRQPAMVNVPLPKHLR